MAASDSLSGHQFNRGNRPTPRLNAVINSTLVGQEGFPDNPGPMVVAKHRESGESLRSMETRPEEHFDLSHPSGIGFAVYELEDKAKKLHNMTSRIINTAFSQRHNIRRDIWAENIAMNNKKRASEDTYNPNEG